MLIRLLKHVHEADSETLLAGSPPATPQASMLARSADRRLSGRACRSCLSSFGILNGIPAAP